MSSPLITTLGALRQSGYRPRSIKDELRENLRTALRTKHNPFNGILGYDDSVLPELHTALLARHNILLLGLRGQAKTRLARLMVNLLDEYIPVVAGSELNDDPLDPLSRQARDLVAEAGEDTPVAWLHRDERYTEKLATPDVSVADLIGDLDPIRAASLKLPYSDERVIHFGLIPRSHRSIFVINELPDLQPRIQVALFNILQEKDIQIRGFKLRLPLDIQFVFTANPEDYTNRGSIVTPLKDRIESQILTHYPRTLDVSREITSQEARLAAEQRSVSLPPLLADLIEQISFEARASEFVDQRSGVSARLTISAYENLVATAERRMLVSGEKSTTVRVGDLYGVIPSITGKVELVYEGEQEGPSKVAQTLISKAIRSQFALYYPNPEQLKRQKKDSPYQPIISWFGRAHTVDLMRAHTEGEHHAALFKVDGLREVVKQFHPSLSPDEQLLHMEFLLHGLSEYSLLTKKALVPADGKGGVGLSFQDMLGSFFSPGAPDEDGDEEEEDDKPRGRRR